MLHSVLDSTDWSYISVKIHVNVSADLQMEGGVLGNCKELDRV